jgi:dihydroneopterin aldolase
MSRPKAVQPPPLADAGAQTRHVFVHDLVLRCSIGVHRHERDARQRVRLNIDLSVAEDFAPHGDKLANVVCYEDIVSGIRRIAEMEHLNLVETLAERIAAFCLEDARVRLARVRIEKLDVYADAGSVGIEIERANASP